MSDPILKDIILDKQTVLFRSSKNSKEFEIVLDV